MEIPKKDVLKRIINKTWKPPQDYIAVTPYSWYLVRSPNSSKYPTIKITKLHSITQIRRMIEYGSHM